MAYFYRLIDTIDINHDINQIRFTDFYRLTTPGVFQGRNPIILSIQSGVRLTEVINNRNQPNTLSFSVRVR